MGKFKELKEKLTSKSFWENYWYYYKIHTWIFIIFVIVTIITIDDFANRSNPDLTVLYISEKDLAQEEADILQQRISPAISDINKDGQKYVQIIRIVANQKMQNDQDRAMREKMMVELSVGDSTLYIYDSVNYDYLKENNMLYADDNGNDFYTLEGFNGVDNLQMSMVNPKESDKGDEKKMKLHENGRAAYKEIVSKGLEQE